jgi:hypothetical protein
MEDTGLQNSFRSKLKVSTSKVLPDIKLQSITGQIFIGQAVLVAHEIGLFKLICKQSLPIQVLSTHTGLHERAVQAMISCAGALSLVECKNGGYRLSRLGKMYLDEDNPEYYGKVLDLLIQEHEIMNYSNVKRALLSNKSSLNQDGSLFANSDSLSSTQSFIDALHQKAFKPAFYWAKMLDLKNYKKFIDIGGGSGIHTIAACLNNPSLVGTICDRQSVLPFTQKYIEEFDLQNRINTAALDMWHESFPIGDIYFFGDIFHDWGIEKCVFLAKKCFQCLPINGQIILHEMLFNSGKISPFLTAAYNMKMMAWTEGQQFSTDEINDILHQAGFNEIKIRKSLGNWSIITGTKK